MGYTPFLGPKPAEKISELSKIYGNVFSLYIGNRLTVILNDYDAIKTAYNDYADIFVDRQPGFAHRALNGAIDGPLTGGPDVRVRGKNTKISRSFDCPCVAVKRGIVYQKKTIHILMFAQPQRRFERCFTRGRTLIYYMHRLRKPRGKN